MLPDVPAWAPQVLPPDTADDQSPSDLDKRMDKALVATLLSFDEVRADLGLPPLGAPLGNQSPPALSPPRWTFPASQASGVYASVWPFVLPRPKTQPETHPEPVTREQAEPIRAWKRARIAWDHEAARLRFCGASTGGLYDADSRSECRREADWSAMFSPAPPDHDAPHLDCRCGFYALGARESLDAGLADHHLLKPFSLEVELSGKVIGARPTGHPEHRVYRAARQRVMCVHVSRKHHCSHGSDDGSSGYGPGEGFRLSGGVDLQVACSRCQPIGLISLGEVASRLGTEVRWDAPLDSPPS